MLIVLNAVQLVLSLFTHNCGFRTRVKCLDLIWILLCILIRLALVCLMFSYLPTYWDMMCKAWNLDRTNWWRSSDEPWFNSASTFNSLVCWYMWFMFQVINWIIIIYGSILCIAIPVGLYRGKFEIKSMCSGLGTIVVLGWVYFKCTLLGKRPDEIAVEIMQTIMAT